MVSEIIKVNKIIQNNNNNEIYRFLFLGTTYLISESRDLWPVINFSTFYRKIGNSTTVSVIDNSPKLALHPKLDTTTLCICARITKKKTRTETDAFDFSFNIFLFWACFHRIVSWRDENRIRSSQAWCHAVLGRSLQNHNYYPQALRG